MTLSDVSIKNPVFAWMLMIGLIVFGWIGFNRMGISMLPDVDFPVITVRVTLEGAAPEVMETEVADPIEDALMSVEGIKEVSSSSRQGQCTVTVELDLNRDIDLALQDVQAKIAEVRNRLPKEMDPPIIVKINPEDQPIIWLALSAQGRPLKDLMTYTHDTLKNQFTTVSGVGEVMLGGYIDPNLRIWIDQKKMHDRELTVQDISDALQKQHVEVPAGYIDTGTQELNVRVMGEAATVEQVENIIIPKRSNGGRIWKVFRIKDVATVEDGLADIRSVSRNLGVTAVGLGIKKQRGANAVAVGVAVKKRMAEVKKIMPPGYDLVVAYDGTRFIEESTHELNFTLVLSALLTAVVCYLFLGSWSSTVNVLLAIPTSILGAFIVLYFLGFTLNTFTLLGLSLAIGIVVDDAIMVLENIVRHREEGESKVHAALTGAREITFAAIAASIAILAIFVPVVFMKGIVGKFLYQFGITMSAAVMLSLLEALTTAPMRCSQFLEVGHSSWINRPIERAMEAMTRRYRRILAWIFDPEYSGGQGASSRIGKALSILGAVVATLVAFLLGYGTGYLLSKWLLTYFGFGKQAVLWAKILGLLNALAWPAYYSYERNPSKPFQGAKDFFLSLYLHMTDRTVYVVVTALLIFFGSLSLGGVIRKEFVPSQDQAMFLVRLETPLGSSLTFTDNVVKKAEEWLSKRKEITNFYAAVGGFEGGEVNSAMMFVTMAPAKERPTAEGLKKPLTQNEMIKLVRDDFSKIPGVALAIVQDLSLSGFTSSRGFPVEFTLRGPDWEKLAQTNDEVLQKMKDSKKMVDVDSDYRLGQPEVQVIPDRAKAAARDVNIESIGTAINATVGGVRVGKFTRGGQRYDVRLRLVTEDRKRPEDIDRIWVRNDQGEVIALSDLVTLKTKPTLQSISRKNRERAISVFASLAPGVSQGEALKEIETIGKSLPAGYRVAFSGSAETFQESIDSLMTALLLGILVAYMVLGSQFNSFVHPITVLLALPFSVTGALLALWIGRQSLNLYSFIGIILLMGIVKKNSILLVDFTNEQRKQGKGVREALLAACPMRLRPIVMTSVATIAGAVPPALGLGPGAETRIPMALVVIGGVMVSTFLTLFVVPCAYALFSGAENHTHDAELHEALVELGEVH